MMQWKSPLHAVLMLVTLPALHLCIAKWGIVAYWAWCWAIAGAFLLVAVVGGVLIFRLNMLKRRLCDDRILYAQKERHAFGRSEFSTYELLDMKKLGRAGDIQVINSYISHLNDKSHRGI